MELWVSLTQSQEMAKLSPDSAAMFTAYYERLRKRGCRQTLNRLVSRRFYRLFWSTEQYLEYHGTGMTLCRMGKEDSENCSLSLEESRLALERGFCTFLSINGRHIVQPFIDWLRTMQVQYAFELHLSYIMPHHRDVIAHFILRSRIRKLVIMQSADKRCLDLPQLLNMFPDGEVEELEIRFLSDPTPIEIVSFLDCPLHRLQLSGAQKTLEIMMCKERLSLTPPVQKELVINGWHGAGSAILTIQRFVAALPQLETIICFWTVDDMMSAYSRSKRRRVDSSSTLKRDQLGSFKGKCILVNLYESFLPATTLSEEFPPADLSKHLGFSERKFIRLLKECGQRFAIESREDDILIINALGID